MKYCYLVHTEVVKDGISSILQVWPINCCISYKVIIDNALCGNLMNNYSDLSLYGNPPIDSHDVPGRI